MSVSTLVVTAEHGGCEVPKRWKPIFDGAAGVLKTHRGWDAGAADFAGSLARSERARLHVCRTTRLLADTNRSLHHRLLFSEWTRSLPAAEREAILDECWHPYRSGVVRDMESLEGSILHVSSHSFSPIWKGLERQVDIGFLYDPSRNHERAFATGWIDALRQRRPDLRLRRNQPYRGNSDGFVSWLRQHFESKDYLGLELEVSQAFGTAERSRLDRDLVDSFASARFEFFR